jgi:DNA-binding transcriptional MerR regulator
MSTDKLFNISEAARATGKSIPTIHNYLKAGKLPNAISTPNGKSKTWQIPLTDLVAARLLDRVESEPDSARNTDQDEIQRLREKVAGFEAKIEQLEARVQDSKEFLRVLQTQLETRETQEARRSWWSRNKPTLKARPEWDSDRD